jgi:hypothetical protein
MTVGGPPHSTLSNQPQGARHGAPFLERWVLSACCLTLSNSHPPMYMEPAVNQKARLSDCGSHYASEHSAFKISGPIECYPPVLTGPVSPTGTTAPAVSIERRPVRGPLIGTVGFLGSHGASSLLPSVSIDRRPPSGSGDWATDSTNPSDGTTRCEREPRMGFMPSHLV